MYSGIDIQLTNANTLIVSCIPNTYPNTHRSFISPAPTHFKQNGINRTTSGANIPKIDANTFRFSLQSPNTITNKSEIRRNVLLIFLNLISIIIAINAITKDNM